MPHAACLACCSHPWSAASVMQAMMELGATVCMPLRTRCQECPLQSLCQAAGRMEGHKAAGGTQEDGPSPLAYPCKVCAVLLRC